MKKQIFCLGLCLLLSSLPVSSLAGKREKAEPVFDMQVMEHHYELQPDSYEATDTTGGYRHYVCKDCGQSYDYHTDPLVYKVNPKTGAEVTQYGAFNPLLPSYEHIPDGEPQVFWSKADGEWRVYLYGSHDDTGVGYCGFDYRLYSAPVYDLSDWRDEGVYLDIREHATSGATVGLFAPDCAYDVNTDLYYLISNEFNAYSVLRVADNPCGPWKENEALWKISVKAAYDPSIYIEDGRIYIAGSCMKMVYNQDPEVAAMVAEDEYQSGMSHIGVLYKLKEDLTQGDGIEATRWLANEERGYLPIYEGPSLLGFVEELGVYVYLYVSNDYGADGTSYNSCLGWLYSDDLMEGTWHYGENKVEEEYTDPGFLISGNHGNIISDTSGRYVRNQESGQMEFRDFPTYVHGNNHGGLAKINGKWYFFGHRQSNAHCYSRQAVAGEVKVYREGEVPVIEPMEYTSSGISGYMDAYATYEANRTCYLLEEALHPAPAAEKNNPHSDCMENTPYVVATRQEGAEHASYVTNLKDGSIVGYRYLDFGPEETLVKASLLISPLEQGECEVEVYVDAPTQEEGGTCLGSIHIDEAALQGAPAQEGEGGRLWYQVEGSLIKAVSGSRSVYLRFRSPFGAVYGLDQFGFEKQ